MKERVNVDLVLEPWFNLNISLTLCCLALPNKVLAVLVGCAGCSELNDFELVLATDAL